MTNAQSKTKAKSKTRPPLPLRTGVGIVLLDRAGRVWVGKKRPRWADASEPDSWQMPQGGINPGEDRLSAALRELEEETGITSVEVLAESHDWLTWELPTHLIGTALKGRYRGQRLRWFVARFVGPDSEIDIGGRHGHKAEFTAWTWAPPHEVPSLTVPFKRTLYLDVLTEFQSLISATPPPFLAE